MIRIEEIERAVAPLSPSELRAFRTWFAEHDSAAWDHQFETDAASDKLDALADHAMADARQALQANPAHRAAAGSIE